METGDDWSLILTLETCNLFFLHIVNISILNMCWKSCFSKSKTAAEDHVPIFRPPGYEAEFPILSSDV